MTTGYKFVDEKKEHLHTFESKPLIGTTTACSVLAKPLTWWAAGMALGQLGWTNPKLVKREDGIKIAGKARKFFFIKNEEYYDWLQECYRAHDTRKKEAGKGGTDMHAELEKYVKGCIKNGGQGKPTLVISDDPVGKFSAWAVENVSRFIWSEAHCYSVKLWTGGITDCGAEMKNGNIAVIDFKSSKGAYFEQFVQAAGYASQIEENGICDSTGTYCKMLDKPIKELYIIPFGASDPSPRPHYDVEGRKKDFEAVVQLYKATQHFK